LFKKIVIFILLCLVELFPWALIRFLPDRWNINLIWVIGAILSLIVIVSLIRWSNRLGISAVSIFDNTWKQYIGPGFIIGLLFYVLSFLVKWQLGGFNLGDMLSLLDTLRVVTICLVLSLYIGFTEEIIFRGYLLTLFQKSFSLPLSIIFSLGLFLLFHLPKLHSLLHSPYAFSLIATGLVYTFVYIRTRSIWLGVGLHWGWDMGAYSLTENDETLFHVRHTMSSWSDPLNFTYITTILNMMLLIIVFIVYRKRETVEKDRFPVII